MVTAPCSFNLFRVIRESRLIKCSISVRLFSWPADVTGNNLK